MSGVAQKASGARGVGFVRLLQLLRQFRFAGQGDIAELGAQSFAEQRQVLRVELTAALLLAGERKEKRGIHPLGRFFHLLTGEDAAEIFAQDDIDPAAELREERDRVEADRHEQNEERCEAEEDASFHASWSADNPPTASRCTLSKAA